MVPSINRDCVFLRAAQARLSPCHRERLLVWLWSDPAAVSIGAATSTRHSFCASGGWKCRVSPGGAGATLVLHQFALLAAVEDCLRVGLAARHGLVLECRTPESPWRVPMAPVQPAATAAEAQLAAAAAGGACSSSFFSKEISDSLQYLAWALLLVL